MLLPRLDRVRCIRRELFKSILAIGLCFIALTIVIIFGYFLGAQTNDELDHQSSLSSGQVLLSKGISSRISSRLLGYRSIPIKSIYKSYIHAPSAKCSYSSHSYHSHGIVAQTDSWNESSSLFHPFCLGQTNSLLHLRHSISSVKLSSYPSLSSSSSSSNSITSPSSVIDVFCQMNPCNPNSLCFFGECLCKPGFGGEACDEKVMNPWYTRLCPNLNMKNTIDINVPLNQVGGEHDSRYSPSLDPKYCSYLCYSHYDYGTAEVPVSLWKAAQKAEGDLWRQVGSWSGSLGDANDRAIEHWKAYDYFNCFVSNIHLGDVIEVGAGPWTQLKGILHIRPDIQVSSFVIWEPSADRYMKEVSNCAYKSGNSLVRWNGSGSHPFPVIVQSKGGEKLLGLNRTYDTVITLNVLEHVQDAWEYLTGIYMALRKGGILIMHERYYDDKTILDGDNYHPIRIKRYVLDKFLSGFHILFNNCSANYEGRLNDRGYYVIATKL